MEPTKTDNGHDLSWAVGHLAQARRDHAALKSELEWLRAEWERANERLIADLEAAETVKDEYDRIVRDMSAATYEETGEKKPHPAIEIKIVESPLFDTPLAEDWARRNMPGLFVFNSKAYGQILRAYHESKTLAGVLPTMPGQMIAEAKAYVSANLSSYLPAPMIAEDEPIPAAQS
jgi:hypothetical protein